MTHCKRELIHLIWLLILDEEFMHAYVHGFDYVFYDGIRRLVFPRLFTYAADYPEKYVHVNCSDDKGKLIVSGFYLHASNISPNAHAPAVLFSKTIYPRWERKGILSIARNTLELMISRHRLESPGLETPSSKVGILSVAIMYNLPQEIRV